MVHIYDFQQIQQNVISGTHIGFGYEAFRFEKSFWHSHKPSEYQGEEVFNVYVPKIGMLQMSGVETRSY